MTRSFDVMVVGAGMVGASAALSMARKGMMVAVIERQKINSQARPKNDQIDLRVSAISPASQQLLAELGVWSELQNQRLCDYYNMCVWHENGSAQMDFSCEQVGASHLGSIVENRLIQDVLIKQLSLLHNVELFSDQAIEDIQQSDDHVHLVTTKNLSLEGDLLIAADGRASEVRKKLFMPVIKGGYHQTAIVANVTTELSHQYTAWQRFLSTGPLAFLPLSNGQSSIVWSADSERADELLQLTDNAFMQQVSEAFEFRLGAVTATSARAGFPLSWHITNDLLKGRVVLMGDAAHGVHPLAGQGVNLGFADVSLLTQLMSQSSDLNDQKILHRYQRQRKAETVMAVHLFSALKQIYGADNPLLCRVRDLGMSLVEKNGLIKRLVLNRAMNNMA